MRKFVVEIVSTFFYIGYLPFMPGTFASIAAVSLFYLTRGSLVLYILVTLIIVLSGFLVSSAAEKLFNKKDAPCIVIDEVSGMLLSLIFIPCDWRLIIPAFILFRAMDILKPYPILRIERLKAGWGVMGDDLMAALYTNIILYFILRFTSLIAS